MYVAKIYKKIGNEVVDILQNGGIAVIPTDTIYGIVGSALNQKTIRCIYKLRRRNPEKPMIILIGSINDVNQFGVALTPAIKKLLRKYWPSPFKVKGLGKPGAVSIILPLSAKRRALRKSLKYLHRGTNTLAFRLPAKKSLRDLLKQTGPLVVPSANWEGYPPAKNIRQAKKYFGARVESYVDAGKKIGKPSRLIRINKNNVEILR